MTGNDPWPHVEVLRIGHRPERDKRITTHVALVSRAFGARAIHIDRRDDSLEKTINSVKDRFGGDFRVQTGTGRKKIMGKWNGTIVHLTMYGAPIQEFIGRIPEGENILVVVGAEKVPADVYDSAHFNIAVSNQPHSEVSALAILLDRLFNGKELDRKLNGGEMEIRPTNTGKSVILPGSGYEERDPFHIKWPPVPSGDQCIEIMTLLGASRSVIVHIKEVHKLGMEMVERSKETGKSPEIDIKLTEAGLLLHDIGRTRTHSLKHIIIGEQISKDLGFDARVSSIIVNHAGGGIPAEEAISLGLPEREMVPKTIEEKIVCHSDNLVGNSKRIPLSDVVVSMRDKGALNAALRIEDLHRELEDILGIDIDGLISS